MEYKSVDIGELQRYLTEKLQEFKQEKYTVSLVMFDEFVEQIVRINRVLQQRIGHLLLVGISGVGKLTLARFVSWLNSYTVFQL